MVSVGSVAIYLRCSPWIQRGCDAVQCFGSFFFFHSFCITRIIIIIISSSSSSSSSIVPFRQRVRTSTSISYINIDFPLQIAAACIQRHKEACTIVPPPPSPHQPPTTDPFPPRKTSFVTAHSTALFLRLTVFHWTSSQASAAVVVVDPWSCSFMDGRSRGTRGDTNCKCSNTQVTMPLLPICAGTVALERKDRCRSITFTAWRVSDTGIVD